MPGVAAFKWQNHTPISDPPRERAVIERAVMLAEPLGLSADGVRGFFELQIRLANEVENQLHERWRARGFDYPQAVPNLTTEVRPQLDRLTGELLSALYLAGPQLEAGHGFLLSLPGTRHRPCGRAEAGHGGDGLGRQPADVGPFLRGDEAG